MLRPVFRRPFSLLRIGIVFVPVFLLFVKVGHAQFNGSIGVGAQLTNNVQSLDTIAPDQLLMPAFELNYDVHPSGVSTVTLSGSYTPSFYHLNPGLSFQETSIGATGTFYLTNQDAISAESEENSDESTKPSHVSHLWRMEREYFAPPPFTLPAEAPTPLQTSSRNDSLVTLADSMLYELSAELDSTDIASKGISKSRVSDLEDLRDSISDVVSTVADLLDSTGYSESAAEVMIEELQDLRGAFDTVARHAVRSKLSSSLLNRAISTLEEAKPEQDYLPVAPTPSAPPSASPKQKQLIQSLANFTIEPEKMEANAPEITLISTATRLRAFGYNDATLHEDVDDSGATTMALTMNVPINYTNHAGVHYSPTDTVLFGGNYGGNPNDNNVLTFGTAFEGLTSTNFSLRGNYAYTHTLFPFDSVYTAAENRVTLTPRLGVGSSTVLFGEGAVGFKKYLTPLTVVLKYDTVHRIKKSDTIIAVTQTAGSNFDQFSYGLGFAQFLGERWLVGALVAFNDNPNLRAYVTTAQVATTKKGKPIRAAAQIADDEYTYNLGRYSLFSDGRIPGDIDLGMDLSFEHRVYGSAVGKKGNVLDSGRTENGTFFNGSVSKLFPLEDRWIGVFNGLLLEAKIELDHVVATQEIYSYDLTQFTFTATLTF